MDLEQEYEKALKIALLFIKFRPRSIGEVVTKLNTKKVPAKIIPDVIKYLEELHWLNDEDFTRLWVDTRLHSKYYGPYRIKKELQLKKIDEFLITEIMDEYYAEQALEEWALRFLENKYRDRIQDIEHKKMIEVLQRNGYDYNSAKTAILLLEQKLQKED